MRRADQMRTLYSKGTEEMGQEIDKVKGEDIEDDELDDQAAYDMIQWSQSLNYNDI